MNVAPCWRLLLVQVPCAVYWKMPWLPPVALQPAIEPSPAPMSEETTATWMFGSPCGAFWRAVMNVGKLLSRFVCDRRIDDELSTMNKRSTLRLTDCWKFFTYVDSGISVGFSRLRA